MRDTYAEYNYPEPFYTSEPQLSGVPLASAGELPPGALRPTVDYSHGINPLEINNLDLYYEPSYYNQYNPSSFSEYYNLSADEIQAPYSNPYANPYQLDDEIVYQSDDECEAIAAPVPAEPNPEEEEQLFLQHCRETVHLPTTKTPVIDTVAMLATIHLSCRLVDDNTIQVTNASEFLQNIRDFCKKRKQTTSDDARVKALSRWFQGIPYKRKRKDAYTMQIKDNQKTKWKQSLKRVRAYVKQLPLNREAY
eukprot:CAMPEP_0168511278 /NCGR_PEP_ID=MMETSP0405-20121227/2028_1 /TAXON_ID=498012 /ORGANISM="Trichosphaerium sp, Strain Am-I-7 wt" /LENGTH=250 /DNA_ID=CAMNT_0008529401 /DNA_START=69 /DNA_END=821 /DNA_ORIENTATION=-